MAYYFNAHLVGGVQPRCLRHSFRRPKGLFFWEGAGRRAIKETEFRNIDTPLTCVGSNWE
ncbi:hypothetical protein HMPREF0281_00441 [Corynebacterium ammoniagenes DSM 20306]|uniref:Uncharacterized protein n=1 Tax=Corynebacterium ammoniagenes DSM 20306 TaxID=649754 RepID=A0ABN0AHQ6_CORAM|nr:hypothetical protein HMPREF0281_00441 [Corynebacterium ammoniagenes DSM 20306]